MPDTTYDLSDMSDFEAETRLGQLVRDAITGQGGCVLVGRGDLLTQLPADVVLAAVPTTQLAALLLQAGWGDDEIVDLLTALHPEEPG